MDQFDTTFSFCDPDDASSMSDDSPPTTPPGSPVLVSVAAVLPDASDDVFEAVPMDYDHRSTGFAAYCVIA